MEPLAYCQNGHEQGPTSAGRSSSGHCRECEKEERRAYRARKREELADLRAVAAREQERHAADALAHFLRRKERDALKVAEAPVARRTPPDGYGMVGQLDEGDLAVDARPRDPLLDDLGFTLNALSSIDD